MGKWDRKVRRQMPSGGNTRPPSPNAEQGMPMNPGKVVATITINLHETGMVSCQYPQSAQYIMMMLASLMKVISEKLEMKKESPIVVPPPGMALPPPPGG